MLALLADELQSFMSAMNDAASTCILLNRIRPKSCPAEERWSLSIGDLIADHPLTPDCCADWRKLNHFGGVAISGQSRRVRRRRRGLVRRDRHPHPQSRRLPALRWRSTSRSASSRCRGFPDAGGVRRDLAGGADGATRGGRKNSSKAPTRHPHTRGGALPRGAAGRELSPGVLAALVLIDPAVRECFEATAEAHGVDVLRPTTTT